MNEMTVQNGQLLVRMDDLRTGRWTKPIDEDRMAVLQIVDPNDVPWVTHMLRGHGGFLFTLARSLEAASRVGMIVFRNSMRQDPNATKKRRKNG